MTKDELVGFIKKFGEEAKADTEGGAWPDIMYIQHIAFLLLDYVNDEELQVLVKSYLRESYAK